MQVNLSALKELSLWDMPKLDYVWVNMDRPQTPVFFQNLRELRINNCHSLTKVLSEGEAESTEMIEFPSLQLLELCKLPNLMGFYTGRGILFNEKLKLSALKELKLGVYPT